MIEFEITDYDIDALEQHFAAGADQNGAWVFDESRRDAIKGWMDVHACPGSGKTTLVAAKLILLSQKWTAKHQGVCVLTHTNVAKDEIIEKLSMHPSGAKLLSYPHFVGTLQEFVNRFLGMPFIREKYQFTSFIDTGDGGWFVKQILGGDRTLLNNLYHEMGGASVAVITECLSAIHYANAELDLCFPRPKNGKVISKVSSTAPRRKMLSDLKQSLMKMGLFTYRDMYSLASLLLAENEAIANSLGKRFPVWLLDEMQDTQKHQDDVIRTITDSDNVRVQRLGDPDQAIFDGIGGEEPNQSYNKATGLHTIKKTHRFGKDIADKLPGWSFNRMPEFYSEKPPAYSAHPHTIFVFDDGTQTEVLKEFSKLIASCDPLKKWKKLKAVGASNGGGAYIEAYWSNYRKEKSVRNSTPKRLIDIVVSCGAETLTNGGIVYKQVLEGLAAMLRNAGRTNYSRTTLERYLKEHMRHGEFRLVVTRLLMEGVRSVEGWQAQVDILLDILPDLPHSEQPHTFLEFTTGQRGKVETEENHQNLFCSENGRQIEVATITSVKGETHDATLVMETKYKNFDIEEMLPYLADPAREQPKGIEKPARMRKLFVGASRPRHLLCLAVHSDRFPDNLRAILSKDYGWEVLILGERSSFDQNVKL